MYTVKPSTTEPVPFQEHVHKSNLFINPTKLTYPTNMFGYTVLYCNRFTILFTQIIHKKQTRKTFLICQYSTLKYSTRVQQLAHRAGIEWTGKKSY